MFLKYQLLEIIARSALYVGERIEQDSLFVCVCVCLWDVRDFSEFPLEHKHVLHPFAYRCFDARIRFCCFWPKINQFEIELPVNSSGLGVPKTADFS